MANTRRAQVGVRDHYSRRPAPCGLRDHRGVHRAPLARPRRLRPRHGDRARPHPHRRRLASVAAEVITALGGLGGAAALITSAATLIQTRRIHARVSPNHGSSISDAAARIEEALDAHGDAIHRIETEQTKVSADVLIAQHSFESLTREVKGIGHEIGDLRATRDREHADYDKRIRRLESR